MNKFLLCRLLEKLTLGDVLEGHEVVADTVYATVRSGPRTRTFTWELTTISWREQRLLPPHSDN